MAAHLPKRPSLRYIQEQAKDLLKAHRQGEASVCAILRAHPRFTDFPDHRIISAQLSLQEVQHALARHYAFRSWSNLKAHVLRRSAEDITSELQEKGSKCADRIAVAASTDDAVLDEVFRAVTSSDKRTKNAAAKVLQLITRKTATKIYPRLPFFRDLLEGDDNILRWIATDVIGNLAEVDVENRMDEGLLTKLLHLLSDDVMITAAHSVDSLGRIALSKPQYRERITAALLRPDGVQRQAECHHILAGKKIDAFARYCHLVDDMQPILDFAKRQMNNSRNATKKKASRLVKKLQGKRQSSS